MPGPNEITAAQLDRLIGTPDCPVIVDLCLPEDFAEDPRLIPGAMRHDHSDLPGLAARLDGARSVMVCQKGRKISQGAAAWLRSAGLLAEYLSSGAQGWHAAPGSQSVPAAALPAPVDGATLWVTRHRPKIDRVACPWLIRRFVDRDARFLFVAPTEVAAVAERFGATAFDVDGPWGHRGEGCSFDTMLDRFDLHSPALDRMAEIILAADTGRADTVAQAPGLLALSVGLSRQYRDDHQQVQSGLALYDALFRWARDGFDEVHDHDGAAA
jgi:rhodanese-related sulfurtransferase